jgi:hypothetical protein
MMGFAPDPVDPQAEEEGWQLRARAGIAIDGSELALGRLRSIPPLDSNNAGGRKAAILIGSGPVAP